MVQIFILKPLEAKQTEETELNLVNYYGNLYDIRCDSFVYYSGNGPKCS